MIIYEFQGQIENFLSAQQTKGMFYFSFHMKICAIELAI